jgi:hypothetical protein
MVVAPPAAAVLALLVGLVVAVLERLMLAVLGFPDKAMLAHLLLLGAEVAVLVHLA